MVMTFAGCACSLENQAIRHEYGFAGYSVILFVLATWFSLTVRDGSRGNPCGNMISFMQGEISWLMTIVRITFQLVGGLASYQYARYFWYLGLTKVSLADLSAKKNRRINTVTVNKTKETVKETVYFCFVGTLWEIHSATLQLSPHGFHTHGICN